ncbi:MAG: hypothetical protein HYS45_00240, partial [Parcubacteria group bacterium]|nr:hypothetical protein [Parcubacteria group bacterium]
GINGTTTPSAILTIQDTAGADSFRIGSSTEALFVVSSSQFVGIASSTPYALLAVEQGTEEASFQISNQGSSTPSFFVGGVDLDGKIGIGTSTPGALLTVQEDNATGNIIEITDANTTTPTFRIAATTGEISTRGDFTQSSRTDLTTLANINDVFVYDTTKDSDGGAWISNAQAQGSSWYNETLDNTGASCTLDTNDRCGQRAFPQKAIIIATNDDLFIFDAKDNTQWMNFDEGSTASTTMSIIGGTSSTHTSVTARDGVIYLANTSTDADLDDGGVVAIDFTRDTAVFYGQDNGDIGTMKYNATIANRNSTSLGYATYRDTFGLVDEDANDVSVAVIAGTTYFAAATDSGVTVLNASQEKAIDFDVNSADDVNDIWLTQDGTLYYDTETAQTLNVFKNSHLRTSDKTSGSADLVYDENGVNIGGTSSGTYPAIFTSAQTINDIFVLEAGVGSPSSNEEGARGWLGNDGNTIFIAHNAGVTALSEHTASSTFSSVKYYGVATTTEEMVGDIRGMWPLNETATLTTAGTDLSDASIKANILMVNDAAGATDHLSASGVRGTAIHFDGSDDYLCSDTNGDATCDDDADFDFAETRSFSAGLWFKSDDAVTAAEGLMAKSATGLGWELYLDASGDACFAIDDDTSSFPEDSACTSGIDYDNATWHQIIGTKTVASGIQLYVDGVRMAGDGSLSAAGTLENSGSLSVANAESGASADFDGQIDEPFVTAQALTPAHVRHMYEVGKQALNNHTASLITGLINADEYQHFYGSTSIATAVSIDAENNVLYVGTKDDSNTGAVSAMGLLSDTIEDVWASDAWLGPKADDDGTVFTTDDVVSVSVSGRYPKTLIIGTDADFWLETEGFSFDRYRNTSVNPHGARLVQTDLTVNQDLEAGTSLTVWGRVLGASVTSAGGVPAAGRPTFRVAADGTVSVRDDLVLQGRTSLSSLSNINDVFVYDTTKDHDNGAWTNDNNAKATSWYNEAIDATGAACDITSNDRCGSRAFPQKAIITATDDNLYVFDAKDNTLWMTFNEGSTSSTTMPIIGTTGATHTAAYALNGVIYLANTSTDADLDDGGVAAIQFIKDSARFYGQANGDIGAMDYKSRIADRNSTSLGYTAYKDIFGLVDEDANDVHAAVVCSENRVSAASTPLSRADNQKSATGADFGGSNIVLSKPGLPLDGSIAQQENMSSARLDH